MEVWREGGREGGLSLGCPKLESYAITTKQTRFDEGLLGVQGREGGKVGGRDGAESAVLYLELTYPPSLRPSLLPSFS